jgi:uncharacterized membrane protein
MAVREDKNNMNNTHNAKYAFYYLLSLVALIFTALSVGMIVFNIIDRTIPDILSSINGSSDAQLKFAISALLIATPIYYLILNLIYRGLRKEEIAKDSAIRRWLTYFTILVSSLIILGVFIGVINSFLAGDLTSQFILKAVTIFILAAAVFSFYFYDIKRADLIKKDKIVKIFLWASLVIIAAAFVASWFFVESPKTARARRLDQAVVSNINNLESVVNSYYDRYQKLPDNLEAVKAEQDIYLAANALIDPETKTPIVYQKLGDKDFQFCATFRTDTATENDRTISYPKNSQNHAAGYQCFKGSLWSEVKAVEMIK